MCAKRTQKILGHAHLIATTPTFIAIFNSGHGYGYGKWLSSGVHYLKVKRLSCSWSMEADGRQALHEMSIAYHPVKRGVRLNLPAYAPGI